MYRFLGSDGIFEVALRLASPGVAPGALSAAELKLRLSQAVHAYQPQFPAQTRYGVELVCDEAFENLLISGFLEESVLDDLPRYRDPMYFSNGPAMRAGIRQEIAYVDECLQQFQAMDPGFWDAFAVFVQYVMCPYSRYSRGGSDSAVRGTLFFSAPRQYSALDLYELLVHEFTHTAMFVDELTQPHYTGIDAVAQPDNFCLASITRLRRPMDKVLHSLVISAEILLHRDAVLGHEGHTAIHPATPRLVEGMLNTAASIRALPDPAAVLTEHGLALVAQGEAIARAHR